MTIATPAAHVARVALMAALFAFCLGACSNGGDTDPAPTTEPVSEAEPASTEPALIETVTIRTFIFSPDPLTVPVGSTVVFENLDSTTHIVTAGTRDAPDLDAFDRELGPGESAAWTLDEPGTYDYHCALHSGPGMTGQVVVEAG